MHRVLSVLACCCAIFLSGVVADVATAAPSNARSPYVVVLAPGQAGEPFARANGVAPGHVFSRVFPGFSAELTDAQVQRLRADPRVRGVVEDRPLHADGIQAVLTGYPPVLPTGVDRVDAEFAPIVENTGVAVLDTGIDLGRPEFNLRGSMSFVPNVATAQDDYGHGTHVAGIAAANAMPTGFRGMAPRAPLWAMKVLDSTGGGEDSYVIAAIDWLTANGPALGIRVANMSLKGEGADTGNCGVTGVDVVDPMHYAICQGVQAGIIFTAAAGNGGTDASNGIPAAYPEVLTVSNMEDLDGRAGALGTMGDDTLYASSDYGAAVDIAAPGSGILSTVPTGACTLCAPNGYTYLTGTSMAAPTAAGAIASYVERHPGVSTTGAPGVLAPAALAVIAGGKSQASPCGFTGDPDAYPEPILYVGIPDSTCGSVAVPDSDGDGLPDSVETQIYGTNPNAVDTDGDGCSDFKEAGGNEIAGGRRVATNAWDFFDVPAPPLTASAPGGTRNGAVSIQDVIAILGYIGTFNGGGANANGAIYTSDLNGNGVMDGREYDRTISPFPSRPWETQAPNGAVSISDALLALQQVGHLC